MPLSTVTRRALLVAAAAALAAGVVACAGSAPAEPAVGGRPPGGPAPDQPAPAGPRPGTAEVDATKRALDARAGDAPATVATWGVDPAAGVVVVEVTGPRTAEVDRFLAGLDPRTLRVDAGAPAVRPLPGTGPSQT